MKSCIFDDTEIPVENQGSASLFLSLLLSHPLPPLPLPLALSPSRLTPFPCLSYALSLSFSLSKIQGVQNNLWPLEIEVYLKCSAVFNFLELPEF